MKNTDRAIRAQRTLESFMVIAEGRAYQKIKREDLIDLLTDLRHWCKHNGESFALAIEWSEQHYHDEREGDSCTSP